MAFLKSAAVRENGPEIVTPRLLLRPPRMSDYARWARLRALSRDFLVPWEPIWAKDELTRAAYRRRIRHYSRELREETGYAFFLFHRWEEHLVGGLTLSHVRRGVIQSATLGYWIGAPFARQGFMSEAVRGVCDFAFEVLDLHRVEAACLPRNTASRRLLEKCGFSYEGRARAYLKINGLWQDHLLYARLATDPKPWEAWQERALKQGNNGGRRR